MARHTQFSVNSSTWTRVDPGIAGAQFTITARGKVWLSSKDGAPTGIGAKSRVLLEGETASFTDPSSEPNKNQQWVKADSGTVTIDASADNISENVVWPIPGATS